MIHGHGNEKNNYSHLIADLSSNVWYKGASKELISVLSDSLASIADYPEPDAGSLKRKIANHYHLDKSNVLVSNGSTEAFYLIAQVYSGMKSTIITPCFAEYADACNMHHHQVVTVSNTTKWQNFPFEEQLVWFANPNNPDGKTVSLKEIEQLLIVNPSSVFVLDEAYIELCDSGETAIRLLVSYPNLIIVRSFTKTFSIPGIRLGYILSSRKIIDKISRFQIPWSINSIALAAGNHIMEHYTELLPDTTMIKKESVALQHEIGSITQLKIYSSNCNFFLVQSLFRPACELKELLINEFGILIRDASNFNGLDAYFFRIAVQRPQMNKLLIKGIKQWIKTKNNSMLRCENLKIWD